MASVGGNPFLQRADLLLQLGAFLAQASHFCSEGRCRGFPRLLRFLCPSAQGLPLPLNAFQAETLVFCKLQGCQMCLPYVTASLKGVCMTVKVIESKWLQIPPGQSV